MVFEVTKLSSNRRMPLNAQPEIPANPESFQQTGLRNIARLTSRGIESLAGLPGDIEAGLRGVGSYAANKLFGTPELVPTETALPTSEQIRSKVTEPLGGEYLAPRGEAEQFGDAVVSDLVPLLLPIKGKIPFVRALTSAGLGNLASFAVSQAGGGKTAQTGAKIGTMIATSLVGPSGIKNYMSSLYKKAIDSIPQGASISAKPVIENIDRLSKIIKKGIPTESKEAVGKIISGIEGKIKNGFIPVDEAIEIKRNINEIVKDLKGATGIEKMLPSITTSLNQVINDYGKRNGTFIRNFREAEGVYKGVTEVSRASKFLQNNVKLEKFLTPITGWLLGLYPTSGTINTIGALFGAREALPAIESLMRSPAIRRYYAKSLAAATANNIPAALKNVKALDKSLAKDQANQAIGRFEVTKLGKAA